MRARPNERSISNFILYAIVDLRCVNNFSCGTHSYNIVSDQISSSLNGKAENIRKEASKQHKHEAYNFSVFSYNVQVLKKYKYELTMYKHNIMSYNFFSSRLYF